MCFSKDVLPVFALLFLILCSCNVKGNVEPLTVKKIVVGGSLRTNCYIYGNSKEVIVFDPGSESNRIVDAIEGREVRYIILTHGHFDHIMALDDLVAKYPNAKVAIHEKDLPFLYNYELNLSFHYIEEKNIYQGEVNLILQENTKIHFLGKAIQVLSISGHTDGSVGFYVEEDKVLFDGDTLMRDRIGYIEGLPGIDKELLISNIENKIFTLPDDVVIYPGHGSETTVLYEKNNNPDITNL